MLTRVNSTLLPIQIALAEAGIPCNAPLDRKALERTGVRTALAYLRMGLDPEALRRDDVLQTIRRPSRGIAPNVVEMATKRPTTSVADIRRLANRSLRSRRPQADGLRRRTRRRRPLRATPRPPMDCGPFGSRWAWARRWTSSTRHEREADRSTHADDLVALEAVAALHPDAASFEPWLRDAAGPTTHRRTGGPAVDHPQDQGPGMGTRHRLRSLTGPVPPPPQRRRRG